MINSKQDFQNLIVKTINSGHLFLTPKHDPNNLHTTYPNDRTVISHEVAGNLAGIINAGNYQVDVYNNNDARHNGIYITMSFYNNAIQTVAASGVTANSAYPDRTLDRIVIVSGHSQGLHTFGEDQSMIQQKISNKQLTHIKSFL